MGLFHWVKKLFKLKQNRYSVSPVGLEYRTKRTSALSCIGIKIAFHAKICHFRE